jgi:hypothetical protein
LLTPQGVDGGGRSRPSAGPVPSETGDSPHPPPRPSITYRAGPSIAGPAVSRLPAACLPALGLHPVVLEGPPAGRDLRAIQVAWGEASSYSEPGDRGTTRPRAGAGLTFALTRGRG